MVLYIEAWVFLTYVRNLILKGDFCMRKRLYAIFLALTAAIGISGGTVFGAAKTTQVDTITLETQTADDEVAVDLGWKTQQDKGRWIDKM